MMTSPQVHGPETSISSFKLTPQCSFYKHRDGVGSQDLIYWNRLQRWGRDWVWYSHQYQCEDRTRRPMLEGQSAAYAEQILSAASDWAFWLVETVMAELQKLKNLLQQLPLNIIQQMYFLHFVRYSTNWCSLVIFMEQLNCAVKNCTVLYLIK